MKYVLLSDPFWREAALAKARNDIVFKTNVFRLCSSELTPGKLSFTSSMTELYFVGYNGYHQFPNNNENHPGIIGEWTSVVIDGTLNSCTHRFVLIETEKHFKIHGLLSNDKKILHEFHKPENISTSESCDEFLIASEKNNIWKYSYGSANWIKLAFKFDCLEEKSVWEETGNRIIKFSFQLNHTEIILLLSNGSVWLLSGDNCLKLFYPYDIDKAIDVSSGLEHSLILTESGCVLAFGNGSRGQLGLGNLDPAPQPVQVAALEGLKVTEIATGGWHSCAVTDSGDLYTWGWNNYGQLSAFENGKEMGLTALPELVDVEDSGMKVVDVACGRRHTIAVLENGDLYSAGWNKYRQLGIEMPCEKATKFTKCTMKKGQNVKLFCGPWYTVLAKKLSK